MNQNIFFLLVFFLLLACEQQEKTNYPLFSERQEPERGAKAVVQGRISNLQVYPHVKEIQLILPDFSGTGEIHTSRIDSSGVFRFEIYPVVAREFSLNPIQDRLLIAPGDSLHIEHDFADFMNTRLSGVGADVNKQIIQFRNGYLGRYTFDYELPYLEYKSLCDQQLSETREKLSVFRDENNTSKLFNQWAEKQVKLDYYTTLLYFPFQQYMRTREEFRDSDAFYSFIPELEQTIDQTMVLTDYYRVVERLNLLKKFGTEPVPKPNEVPFSPKEIMIKLYESSDNPFLSQFAVVSYLSIETRANLTQTIDEEEEELHRMITDPFLRASLQGEYNRVKNYLANPRVYSDAVMGNNRMETSGGSVHPEDSANIVKHLIEANPGKVLYIDVWAPWCAPCVREMPYSEELSDALEGEPIVFVYLCMGGSRDEWQQTIDEYGLTAVHHYLSSSEWMDMMKRFGIKGIPHYLLFNRKGVMVDFGGHLRPSAPETGAAIRKLLKE